LQEVLIWQRSSSSDRWHAQREHRHITLLSTRPREQLNLPLHWRLLEGLTAIAGVLPRWSTASC
jgi:hypothetical protein